MPQLGSEFWAAIAGAIVGGAIAAILQLMAARAAAKEKSKEQRERQLSLARTLLFKVVKIQSDFVKLKEHVNECATEASDDGLQFGWASLLPLANLPRPVFFRPEEMGVLVSFRDDTLFNDLLSLDDVHAAALELMTLYRDKRASLSDSLPAKMRGTIGTVELTEQEYRKVAPRIAELDQLARQIAEFFQTRFDEPFALAKRLAAAINNKFSTNLELKSHSGAADSSEPGGSPKV